MKKFMTYARNRKGVTLVLMAIMLAVLIMFASLAIDISYMYFAKNQLQVAADSAALAGAALLHTDTSLADYPIQSAARAKAIEFAAKNKAAGIAVALITDDSTTLSDDNDITVGNWQPSRTPPYLPGGTPINAIEVQSKRVSGLDGSRGPVRLFLGPIFQLIGADWTFMSARSYAIAARPPKASAYFAVCQEACVNYPAKHVYNPPLALEVRPQCGTSCRDVFAWSSLLQHSTNTSDVSPLICGTSPYVDVCSQQIYTTGGTVSDVQRDLEGTMYDRSFDSANKEFYPNGNVKSWTVIVPVTETCPPTAQGGNVEPKNVFGYAKLKIAKVCTPGGTNNACNRNRDYPAWPSCSSGENNKIQIEEIQCVSCPNIYQLLGLKASLVK